MLVYNGNNYDFKVLNLEMNRILKLLLGNIYCVDFLEAFRVFDLVVIDEFFIIVRNFSNIVVLIFFGQNILEILKDVFDIKLRVRQIKRKCDVDFDRFLVQVKFVRKRFFDLVGKKDEVENGDLLDLIGYKLMGLSMKMLVDVVSKRNICDVEFVKKRLIFDEDDDENEDDEYNDDEKEDEDVEMLVSEENKNQCQENIGKLDGIIFNLQGSLLDVDFLQVVEYLEYLVLNSIRGLEIKIFCVIF